MSQTLWERLTKGPEPTAEEKHFNPLKAKIGASIDIDLAEYKDLAFFVHEIREVLRKVNGKDILFADYSIRAKDKAEEINLRLRVNDRILLLSLFDDMTYNKDVYDAVTTSKQFEVKDDEQVDDYWRIGDVGRFTCDGESLACHRISENEAGDCPNCKRQLQLTDATWDSTVTSIHESTRGVKTEVVAKPFRMDYWDYSRMVADEAGQEFEQFLFVEMDKDSGRMQIWRGRDIDPARISIV